MTQKNTIHYEIRLTGNKLAEGDAPAGLSMKMTLLMLMVTRRTPEPFSRRGRPEPLCQMVQFSRNGHEILVGDCPLCNLMLQPGESIVYNYDPTGDPEQARALVAEATKMADEVGKLFDTLKEILGDSATTRRMPRTPFSRS